MISALLRFRRQRRGTAMLQFALAGPPFLLLTFMIIESGILLFTQAALDNATRDAARLIMTNQATSSGDFTRKLCAELGGFIPCSSIRYHVQSDGSSFSNIDAAVTVDGSGDMTSTGWSPGGAERFVLVQVGYNRKYLVPWLARLVGGTGGTLLLSTFAFQNEPHA